MKQKRKEKIKFMKRSLERGIHDAHKRENILNISNNQDYAGQNDLEILFNSLKLAVFKKLH
jgi:hypothetical protein